ncbi:MAG: FAD-binding oxidoreductase [Gaiellaceae bacterium]
MSQATLSTHDLASLRSRMAVSVPDDADWNTSRLAWNRAHDQQPLAVVFPETAEDVAAAVDFAREQGVRITAQATGHFAVTLAPLDEAILVKTERMRGVEIDAGAGRARTGAGAQWGEVAQPAAEHGLAGLAGSAPDVGVVGYSLGGGLGWLGRKYGLAANSIVAAEIVTADGQIRRIDHGAEPDLFWAIRGGGGSFGLVTALEFDLYPVRELYAGDLFYPVERAAEVLHAWREWVATVPDELTSVGRVLHLPPIPDVPEPMRGKSFGLVEVAFMGDEAEGAELVRPFRELEPLMDTIAMIPPPALAALHMDPPEPAPALYGGGMLESLSAGVVDELAEAVGRAGETTLLSIEIRQLGGALAQPSPDHGAVGALNAEFAHFSLGLPMTPEMGSAIRSDLRRVLDVFEPADAGRTYFNFSGHGIEPSALFPPETLRRLQAVKRDVDPDDLFLACHPVAPA